MSHACVIVAIDATVDIDDINAIEKAVAYQMEPFNENGEWFADGSRWDWYVIGGRFDGKLLGKNVVRRGELSEDAMREHNREKANALWDDFEANPRKDDAFIRDYMYGLGETETREQTIEKYVSCQIWAYAFLANRKWIESERMGFFGVAARTECEIASDGQWTERCVTRDEDSGSMIATFTGPKDSEDQWRELYFARFIRNLPGDTILVVVDYHV